MLTRTCTVAPLLLAMAGCTTPRAEQTMAIGQATLATAGGMAAGTARISDSGQTVTLRIEADGLQPGTHGVHLHAVGACTGPAFASAGPHLNPGGREHGTDNPAGSHLGDLPNLVADASGRATLTAVLPGTRDDLTRQLFDADGTAVVIHAGPDDYKTDPSGNSGGRIACGVLSPAG